MGTAAAGREANAESAEAAPRLEAAAEQQREHSLLAPTAGRGVEPVLPDRPGAYAAYEFRWRAQIVRARCRRPSADRVGSCEHSRLRFELLLGHSGGETRELPTSQDNDDRDDGARSDDEETPDRAAEPGPSEQPPETGHPNDGSQADDEFTVMDVDEEQPEAEHEASQPPRKRGRFENERSDSMSQGRGRASNRKRMESR